MDKFFKFTERGSSLSTEIMGGLATFLTMSYIIFVNPSILEAAGIPFAAALTATCFGAALMTIAMGLIANRPLALASGMGLNAIVAFALVLGLGLDWRVAMAIVFAEGILITILVLAGLREAIMKAIPVNLRRAIGVGIGLFISFIGLKGGELIVANDATLIGLGDLTSPVAIVAIVAIVLTVVLMAFKVKGDILFGIIGATLVGIPLGVTQLPKDWGVHLDFSTFGAPFQMVDGSMAILQIFTPLLLLWVFAILMSDFFDTMGTIVAVGEAGGFADKEGNVENTKEILLVDSVAAATGGLIGASSITTYVESGAGVAEGARTGLSSVVVGILFILAAFLTPIVGMVSAAATTGALVVVGFLMMGSIAEIDWSDFENAFPAFLTIVMIPLTYNITNGIGFGFIGYVVIKALRGKFNEIHPLMWVSALAFLFVFLQSTIIGLFS